MSSTQLVLIVLIVVVIAAAALVAVVLSRRRALQEKFGEEYARLVAEHNNSKSAAERELRERERRHAQLQLRELTPQARDAYATRWQDIQALFVDEPEEAVRQADALITEIAGEIGYPTENDALKAQLSVDHGTTLTAYRRARQTGERARSHEADVDELRQAIVDYRELVAALLGTSPVPSAQPAPAQGPDAPPASSTTS